MQALAGLAGAGLIATLSYRFGLLTLDGSVAQFLLGFVLLGLGGWEWTIPVLFFFLSSSMLSRSWIGAKRGVEALFEKPGARDAKQVLANGGIAGMLALASFLAPSRAFYPMYLGAVAAAAADTWATEIGLLSRRPPRLLPMIKAAERGRSGGVTWLGLGASLGGSLAVWLSGAPWALTSSLAPVVLAGIAGSLADSLLGATCQAHYRCRGCKLLTERRVHCGEPTELASGIAFCNNDAVNLAATAVGAAVPFLVGSS